MIQYPVYRNGTFSYNCNLRPVFSEKNVQLSHFVIDLMKRVSKAKLPTCLAEPFKEKVFEACVEELFASLTDQERDAVLIQIGNFPGRRPKSIIEEAASTLNYPRVVRALVLGRLLGISPENLFETFPITTSTHCNYLEKTDTSQLPSQLVVGEEVYFLDRIDYQLDFQGYVSHAVMEFRANSGAFFHLLASRTAVENRWGELIPTLTLGKSHAPNFVLGAVEIDDNPESIIFLPLDLHTALALRQKVKRAEIPSTTAVVSGIVGGTKAAKGAELKVLAHHQVVLLPDCSREGLLAVFDVVKLLRAVNADAVLYPWPLLVNSDYSGIDGEAWEQNLHRNATSLKRVEDVSALLYRLNEDAMTPEEFEIFLKDIGMIPVENASIDTIASEELPKVKKFSDLSRGHTENYKSDLARIFNVGQISLLWGPSNSGKSLIAASFALAIASGKSMFGVANTGSKRKVLIVDGELTEEELANRYEQVASAYELTDDDLDRISFIPTRSYEVDDCNLLDGNLGMRVCTYVQQNRCDVVILDNLITLAPTSARGNEDALFAVIRNLERLGAAVIIVHHATKDGNSFKGSSNLASKSQNILKIEGRCDLEAEKEYSPTLRRAFDAKGAICRLRWEKCKTAPGLEGQTRTWQLPVGKPWQDLDVQVETESSCADGAEVANAETSLELTSGERKVLALFSGETERIRRTDVERTLSCREDKASSILKSLVEKGQLESIGAGRGTKYQRVG